MTPPAIYSEPVTAFTNSYVIAGEAVGTRSVMDNEVYLKSLYTQPVEADYSIELLNKISKFHCLKDNWDGYGAVPPSEAAIQNVVRMVEILPEMFATKLNKDDITPTPYGTILVEWVDEQNSLTLEIGDEKIGLVSDFGNSPQIVTDGELFNGEELPNKLIPELFKLF
jgi:hypothetical protein